MNAPQEKKKALKPPDKRVKSYKFLWCRRPDSNRHGEYPTVFETAASANSATSASLF
jgi:hypothetical protein